MSPQHRPGRHQVGYRTWYGTCSCGWVGPARRLSIEARDDAHTHQRTAAAPPKPAEDGRYGDQLPLFEEPWS